MDQVIAYSGMYRGGSARSLAPGVHYDVNAASLHVPEGYEAHIRNDHNDGDPWVIVTTGTHADQEFYIALPGIDVHKIPRIEVKKVDYDTKALVFVGGSHRVHVRGNQYAEVPWSFGVPPSAKAVDHYCLNDSILWVDVPKNGSITLYENTGGGGASITFDTPGRVDLTKVGWANPSDHNYGKQRVSSVKVVLDGWSAVGAPKIDWSKAKTLGTEERIGTHGSLDNSGNSRSAQQTDELSVTVTEEVETHFDMTAGGSLSTSVSVGTGDASPVAVESQTTIEVNFSASHGGSNTTSKSVTISRSVTAEVGPGEVKHTELVLDFSKKEAPITQTLKNDRTGQTVEITGTVTMTLCGGGHARISDQPLS